MLRTSSQRQKNELAWQYSGWGTVSERLNAILSHTFNICFNIETKAYSSLHFTGFSVLSVSHLSFSLLSQNSRKCNNSEGFMTLRLCNTGDWSETAWALRTLLTANHRPGLDPGWPMTSRDADSWPSVPVPASLAAGDRVHNIIHKSSLIKACKFGFQLFKRIPVDLGSS